MRLTLILCSLVVILLVTVYCGRTHHAGKHDRNSATNQKSKEPMPDFPKEITKMLEDLNYWVAQGGDPEHPINAIKSTGESHSKYLDLKEKIASAGYALIWSGDRYLLVDPEEE